MIIGITGGTGCGKTTLLRLIRDRGGMVLDCDVIYHELLNTDPKLLMSIADRFPGTVERGVLDRKKLGKQVFSDENALLDLNTITHGAVKREVQRRLNERPALAAIDAIALFESGLAQLCDVTVAVLAPYNVRVDRLMKRDGISAEYAESRIRAQHSDGWFRDKCDHILINDATEADFRENCLAFLSQIGIMKI